MKLELPFPPSVNTYWRKWQNRMVLSPKGRQYKQRVYKILLEKMNPRKPMMERVILEVVLYPPDKRRRDIDNHLKGLLDALQHAGLFLDDSQVDKITLTRGPVVKGGIVEVSAREVEGGMFDEDHLQAIRESGF